MQRLTHHGLSNLHLDDVLVDVVPVVVAGDAVVNIILSNVMLAMWEDAHRESTALKYNCLLQLFVIKNTTEEYV